MSEQPVSQLPDGLPDSDFVAWHDVAQKMPSWHEAIHRAAVRKLGEHDLAHLTEVPPIEAVLPPLSETTPAREAISLAFDGANKMLHRVTQDPHFDAYCVQKGVGPYDTETAAYWGAVEGFVLKRTASIRAGGNGDELKLSALELLAATPNFLVNNSNIKKHNELQDASQELKDKSREGRESNSRFQDRIRAFATRFPNTRASTLSLWLLKAANAADLEYSGLASNVESSIRTRVRGAQYEMAFGQILAVLGENFRPSRDAYEDLHGIDWVVGEGTSHVMGIDIKSSLTEIDALNGSHNGTPYYVKPNGDIVLYPLLTDVQFHNTFYISEQAVAKTAPMIDVFLKQARDNKRLTQTK